MAECLRADHLSAMESLLIAEVLARALLNDPMESYVTPDPVKRERTLQWKLGCFVRYGIRFGELYITSPRIEGAAVWCRPGGTPIPITQLCQVGLWRGVYKIGRGNYSRFNAVARHTAQLKKLYLPKRYWYLQWLGVDPLCQGRGIGGGLLRPVLSRADRDGEVCALDTFNPQSVPFYESHGFKIVGEGDVPNGGPRLWVLKRDPLAGARAGVTHTGVG